MVAPGNSSDSPVRFEKTVMVSDSVRMLEKAKSGTRVSMVMAAILQRIAGRSLTPGDKLPSIRSFAVPCRCPRPRWSRPMIGW